MPELSVVSQVVTLVAGAAGILALILSAVGHAQQWPGAFQYAAGWLMALLGVAVALGATGWLASSGLIPLRGPDAVLIGAAVVGVAISVAGVGVAKDAPYANQVESLRVVLKAAEDRLMRLQVADGFDSLRPITLTAKQEVGGRVRAGSLARALTRPPGRGQTRVMVLYGASGAGKSATLRHLALEMCRRAWRRRRPAQVAIYVDLAMLQNANGPITSELIRNHIRDTIAAGDSIVAEHLNRHLRTPRDRPEWLFLFDSFDELPALWDPDAAETAARQCLDAIQQFLNTGSSFRGIIATRDLQGPDSLAGPRLTVAPLSTRQQHKLVRQADLPTAAQHRLFHRLSHDPALESVAGSPLLLRLLCDHLCKTGTQEIPGTLHEVMKAAVTTHLKHTPEPSLSIDEVHRIAEYIAYCMATEPGLGTAPSRHVLTTVLARHGPAVSSIGAAMELLTDARVAQPDRPHTFAFAHRAFQDYFATCWLLRGHADPRFRTVLTDPRWREPAIAALQVGSDQVRRELLTVAAEILAESVEGAPGVVQEVASYLAADPSKPPWSGEYFTWPPNALHVLRILTRGLQGRTESIPAPIRAAADRLVVSAFDGIPLDQKQALEILLAAGPDVAAWAVEHVEFDIYLLISEAAERLAVMPEVFGALRIHSRTATLRKVATNPALAERVLAHSNSAPPGSSTLTSVLRRLVRIGKVFAVIVGILYVQDLVIELAGQHRPTELVAYSIPVVIGSMFLYCWTRPRQRMAQYLGRISFWSLLLSVAFAALLGIVAAIAFLFHVLTANFGEAAESVILAYLFTWPMTMGVHLVVGQSPTLRDWFMPQLSMGHMVASELRKRDLLGKVLAAVRLYIVAAVVIAALYFAGKMPIPFVVDDNEDDVRGFLYLSLIGSFMLLGAGWSGWRRYVERRRIREQLTNGAATVDAVRSWLHSAQRQDDAAWLLNTLAKAKPEAVRPAIPVLIDLARALQHVARFVPKETKSPIPMDVWDVGVAFSESGFRDWLVDHDKRYPGRLSWLASSSRDALARAIERADTTDAWTPK